MILDAIENIDITVGDEDTITELKITVRGKERILYPKFNMNEIQELFNDASNLTEEEFLDRLMVLEL